MRPGDLNEVWEYLAKDNIEAADRVISALQQAFQRLAQQPGLGHSREDLADRRHRFLLVYSYLVVYRPSTNPLQIVRVLHAARDVQLLLRIPKTEM